MNITFACPECETTSRQLLDDAKAVSCPACQWQQPVPEQPVSEQPVSEQVGQSKAVPKCLVCNCDELFVRKNFSQRVGVGIVVLAAVSSSIAWAYHRFYLTFGILFAAAALDLILYFSVGNLLQCYRCHAEYRGLPELDTGEPFSLETHERFRQQAIRLAESQAKAKGT